MKPICLLSVIISFLFSCNPGPQKEVPPAPEDPLEFAYLRVKESLSLVSPRPENIPRTLEKGKLKTVKTSNWVSGFYPGLLWYIYDYSNEPEYLKLAKKWTGFLEAEKYNDHTHDTGFIINCSYGNGLRLMPLANPREIESYKKVIVLAAKALSSRFNPKVGLLKSWDWNEKWQYPVIIDNMMNLELLFNATRISGDSSFYHIAVTHAKTTIKTHFRPDGSSYHVVDFDPLTGEVNEKVTHQGAFDESAWARGQAWGLYGFTVCYRETRDSVYLQKANEIAKFILSHPHLPEDMIPYWDFDAKDIPNTLRDVSAAAILASAFMELGTFNETEVDHIIPALKILKSLSSPAYRAPLGSDHPFLLLHSVGSKPGNSEVDVPLIYADYYYLEALIRKRNTLGDFDYMDYQ
ncbi:glycoside hydrolase family 88 protein [bacterium]|nr:glycoside hydrolase family 88 protein [bacterium]